MSKTNVSIESSEKCQCFKRYNAITHRILTALTTMHEGIGEEFLKNQSCRRIEFMLNDIEAEILKRQNTTGEIPR